MVAVTPPVRVKADSAKPSAVETLNELAAVRGWMIPVAVIPPVRVKADSAKPSAVENLNELDVSAWSRASVVIVCAPGSGVSGTQPVPLPTPHGARQINGIPGMAVPQAIRRISK
jgi:hypothetical protein